MTPDSQIVVGPDGIVLTATGQLPSGLVDVGLDKCEGLPPEVREAGKALLDQLRASESHIVTQTVALGGEGRTVQLVAVEALAVRRRATDIRALLASKLDVLSFQGSAVGVTISVGAGFDPARSHVTIDVQDDGPGIPAVRSHTDVSNHGTTVRLTFPAR